MKLTNKQERGDMARIRLNQEYRNKIANRIKQHLFQEDTQEKRKYDELKGQQLDINDNAWSIAEKIVRRHYTPEDVEKAYYLQNKFDKFLDDMVKSPISNKDYQTIHDIFNKHLKLNKKKERTNGKNKTKQRVPKQNCK